MNAFLTMSSFVFPLLTFPYVSRILMPEGMGKVAMGTAVVAYFAMLARLGIPLYGIRACAEVRDDRLQLSKVVHELFLINLFMTGVSYIVFFSTVFAVPSFRTEYVLYLIIGSTLFFETIGVEWLYKALEEYSYITYRSIFFKMIALIPLQCAADTLRLQPAMRFPYLIANGRHHFITRLLFFISQAQIDSI